MNKYFLSLLLVVLLPFISYGTDPHVIRKAVVVPQKVVEFDADYFLGEDYYYQLGQKLVDDKNKSRDDEIKDLKSKLDLLLTLLSKGNNGQGQQPGLPTPPPPEPEPVKNEINDKILTLWNRKCVNCHGTTPQNNGLTLVKGGSLEDLSLEQRLITYDRVLGYKLQERGLAKMPKGGSLTDEEVNLVYEWCLDKLYGGK